MAAAAAAAAALQVRLECNGTPVPDDGPFPAAYQVPPVRALLLTAEATSTTFALPVPPPESVLHELLLGQRLPLHVGDLALTLSAGAEDEEDVEEEAAALRYRVEVHGVWAYDHPGLSLLDIDGTRPHHHQHGLVTPTTRVLVQGRSCHWLSPRAACHGAGGLASDAVLLGELCLRVALALQLPPATGTPTRTPFCAPGMLVVEGPCGAGKTALVGAAARALGLYTVMVRPGTLLAEHDVDADEALDKAAAAAAVLRPALLLLDDADLLVPGRRVQASKGDVDRALERWITRAEERGKLDQAGVMLVMTARPGWRADTARADRRMAIPAGYEATATRAAVLAQQLLQQAGDTPPPPRDELLLQQVAHQCQGFTLGGVAALARRARRKWRQQQQQQQDGGSTTTTAGGRTWHSVLDEALAEGRAEQLSRDAGLPAVLQVNPPVSWGDVGGLRGAKESVQEMIAWPVSRPKAFARLGIMPPTGLLLYGPPGTGKTLIAKAAACQTGAGFLSLRISDIVRGEIGTAEVLLRDAFRAALKSRPVVIFIDEFQALFAARGGDGGGSSSSGGRLASQLLQSMDELREEAGGGGDGGFVSVLAATNAPEAIDAAFLRPGRFDRLVYVALPDEEGRAEILEGLRGRMRWAPDVDVGELAAATKGYSGADLANLLRRAALHALAAAPPPQHPGEEVDAPPPFITREDVLQALTSCRPTTSPETLAKFQAFQERQGRGRGRVE